MALNERKGKVTNKETVKGGNRKMCKEIGREIETGERSNDKIQKQIQ